MNFYFSHSFDEHEFSSIDQAKAN